MTKLALRHWVLLTTLVPTLVVSLGLASYFSLVRHQDLAADLSQQAENIAAPLAIASEHALLQNSRQDLKRLLDASHRKNPALVKSIAIFNADHELLVTTNYHKDFNLLKFPHFAAIPAQPQLELTDDYLVMRYPIIPESVAAVAEPLPLGYVAVQLSRDKNRLRQQSALLGTLLLVVLALGFAVYASLKLVKRISTPVRQMNDVIRQLSQGHYRQQLPDNYLGELELLRRNINSLASALKQHDDEVQQSIEQATSDLQQSLEQLEMQNIELDLARKRALEDNRSKSDFLAKMSHELRTPLNAVIGFTRQLLKTNLTSNQQDYLATIQKSANSLLSLVNDVLDYAKLEEGRMPINPEPFSLRDLLNDATELLAANAFDKQLELVLFVENNCPDDLVADPVRINQILTNLAGNAIKFTEQGSVLIRVSGRALADDQWQLKFAIHDTGIGISEEQQKQLFDGFSQGDQHIGKRYGGTGLGLVISQRLVQAMGGRIGFDSRPGEGSVFWFTLQCKRHPLSIAEPLPLTELKQKNLLYFEPQQNSREAMLAQLEHWGLQVTSCSNMTQLSQTLSLQPHFDLILLGRAISLTQVNQVIELLQQLRQHSEHIYMLVNTLSPNLREVLQASGASAVLAKPSHYRKLASTLAQPYLQQNEHSPASEKPKARLRVLSVDDNEANLKLINALLSEMVEQVDSATNGAEAWQKASQMHYDVIFMDINMPVMDGIQACQRIQQSSLNEATPIIAVTAHALDGERERLLDLGFCEFLTKPLDEKLLLYTLRECCPEFQSSQVVESEHQLPNSKQLDWTLALQRAGGKLDLAKEMLWMLVKSLPDAQKSIGQAMEANNNQALLQHIHKLHGASCYTGLPVMKQLTELLETQLKKGASIAELEPELFELQDRISALLQDAAQWPELV
ncbi:MULTISPECIES: two-component sensor histidine kinase BarA [Rheinheimera]|uniref:histidine kinase n=1 Tax=Rheinheimera marina TaxID=1774958 RepID=A0ABV9JGL8_9GAMM